MEVTEKLEDKLPTPDKAVEKSIQAELVREALSKLSDEKKEVLILSRFQGMKYEEISEIMGCKVGTVKARVHRAIKDLTQHYHELSGMEAS